MTGPSWRSRFSGLPISIAIHLVALLVVLIIPLAADVVLPTPITQPPEYVRVSTLPPPDVAMAPRPRAATVPPTRMPAPSPLAPIVAPPSLQPETPRAVSPGPLLPDAANGVPVGGDGTTPGESAPAPRPPDPPRPSGPVRAGDLPVAPRKIADVRPVYPEIARTARIQGTVVMEAVLDSSGRVTQLHVIQSVPTLDQAALDAVRQWRYAPSVYGGHPVSVLMTITIRFTLQP